MSQFLDRRDCIESLRKDLIDLQGAILDVFSRTGPVRVPSWKFPDKLSCNLDMVALLERCDFVDGEGEFNQHSHTVLLELVIDRLLLLLQSFSSYVERVRCSQPREQPQHKGCLSVGLVVRNYWSHLVHFVNLMVTSNDLSEKQTRPKTSDCDETEAASFADDSCRQCLSAWSSTSSFKFLPHNHVSSGPFHNNQCCPKADNRNVSCQTVESSLCPCDACYHVQSILKKTGNAFVELLQSEGLPSSLQPLLSAVEDTLELGHMTAGDVTQWANEQSRDMRRLEKHLQHVRRTVDPLKDRLAAAETERERLHSQLEKARQQTQKHQATIVQLEFSLQKAQRAMKATEQKLHKEQQLKRESLSVEESNTRLKEELVVQQGALRSLECENIALQEKVKSKEDACCKLQQTIQQIERRVSETHVLLDKENAKYLSACRQQESMQTKQKSLLERVDALDEECEELQRQLGESEEKQTNLQNQLQQMSKEKEQLQAQLSQQQNCGAELQKEKQMLETNMGELQKSVAELKEYVQAMKERERLLVAFPELSPLSRAQPQSTGNVLLDMEKQMQANGIRVKVLEKENVTLRSSLDKLRERERHNATM
ncbi:hypothetical protein JOB18_023977 [Solea senegalensis]|nr:coiled-coil domain-containing protein 157 isoform X2 [Solea senegalensis]KAG7489937.1 hypothetical protein JOB18_023977 [Solea senegalensis]